MEGARRLRKTTRGESPHLIPHVRVAIVEAYVKRIREKALDHCAEDKLVGRGKVRHRPLMLREDVLPETDDAHALLKPLEQVAHFVGLAHVIVLVHVERLYALSASKNDCVVLILGFPFADDGVARQLHLEQNLVLSGLG
eukprot:4637440-Prymnesium_polylepis.2